MSFGAGFACLLVGFFLGVVLAVVALTKDGE